MCDCDATILLNVYIYLVFVGEGYLALMASHMPNLKELSLTGCYLRDRHAKKFLDSISQLEVDSCQYRITNLRYLAAI
jgi:Ran GTPase-activating protein (RanGAP) involved in mRNA processing and transport